MPSLFYPPKFQGLPGSKLTFTRSGTTTPQNVYTDEALAVAHSNPVVADANGVFAPIYLDPRLPSYRVLYSTAADVQIYQVDDYPSNQNTATDFRVEDTTPSIILYDTDGLVNARKFRIRVNSPDFEIALSNDAESSFTDILRYDGAANTLSIVGGAPLVGLYAKKTTDTSRLSTTTLADDPSLSIALGGGGSRYIVEGQIDFDAFTANGAMGIKACLAYTGVTGTGTVANICQHVNGSGSVASSPFSTSSPLTHATISDTANHVRFTTLVVSTTPGTLSLQWAQNSSTAQNLTVRQGSWIRANRIGTATS